MSNEIEARNESTLATQNQAPMGFEDESDGDLIVPRIKVVQSLSPEFKDRTANEGDIINSLTKDKYNGLVFIPVFKFNNNIWWKPRNAGGGMSCFSKDGKVGVPTDGSPNLMCLQCKKNEFDNSKQGAESYPVCSKYINFFGFIRGEDGMIPMPIIMSFAKTNYNEGKKMYSLAKVTMQNMWNHGYRLDNKKMSKVGNEWFIINPTPAGATSAEEREFGMALYNMYRQKDLNFDIEDTTVSDDSVGSNAKATDAEVAKAEF